MHKHDDTEKGKKDGVCRQRKSISVQTAAYGTYFQSTIGIWTVSYQVSLIRIVGLGHCIHCCGDFNVIYNVTSWSRKMNWEVGYDENDQEYCQGKSPRQICLLDHHKMKKYGSANFKTTFYVWNGALFVRPKLHCNYSIPPFYVCL